ncbi:ABC transporter, permease protein [Neisseria flavescens]|nr:ABC transporter, permease protein [Neisseria flavescens]
MLGILAITFAVIQFVPGGPVEQMVQQLTQGAVGGETAGRSMPGTLAKNGNRISAEDLAALNALYGFDKPPLTRFVDIWYGNSPVSIWARAFSTIKPYLSW